MKGEGTRRRLNKEDRFEGRTGRKKKGIQNKKGLWKERREETNERRKEGSMRMTKGRRERREKKRKGDEGK